MLITQKPSILIIFFKIYKEAEDRINSILDETVSGAIKPPLGQLNLIEIEKAEATLCRLWTAMNS